MVNQNQDQFQDITEILSRHRNLSSSLAKLSREDRRIVGELAELKSEYLSYVKNTSNEILRLNLDIGELEKQIEVGSPEAGLPKTRIRRAGRNERVAQLF